ncbi:hypothetical protein Micbo1qcDRAFT_236341 [Microdochium bolleyi]|uniref:Uncharacterized protein n=1 Tax=Microdochium bolleyi TaxID=196109 RepID=A0A136IR62_9PEZI|nr:hypothetical protein Micbo1qcDRAFT_236341 [Microdochium bolleyi]
MASLQILPPLLGPVHKKRHHDETCLPPAYSSPISHFRQNHDVTAVAAPQQARDNYIMGGTSQTTATAGQTLAARTHTLKDYAAQWALLKQGQDGSGRNTPSHAASSAAQTAAVRQPSLANDDRSNDTSPAASPRQPRDKRRRLTAAGGDEPAQQHCWPPSVKDDYVAQLSRLEEQNGRRLERIGHGYEPVDSVNGGRYATPASDDRESRRAVTPVGLEQRRNEYQQPQQHFPSPQLARLDALRRELQQQPSPGPSLRPNGYHDTSTSATGSLYNSAPEVPSNMAYRSSHEHHQQHGNHEQFCCPETRSQLRAMTDRVRGLEAEVSYHLAQRDQVQHLADRVRELEGEVGFLRRQLEPRTH